LGQLAHDVAAWIYRHSKSKMGKHTLAHSKEELRHILEEFVAVQESSYDDLAGEQDIQKKFRKAAQILVDDRKIALGAMKRGLTLNGSLDLSLLFGSMPSEAIEEIFFARQNVKAEDIISSLAYFSKSSCTEHQENILRIFETENGEKCVEGYLPSLLHERGSDAEFLAKFVQFASGSSFIPNSDFKILVEFTSFHDAEVGQEEDEGDKMSPDALPIAHTCENTLTFPATAYYDASDGGCSQQEYFEHKLIMALDYSGHFNMK
jgi:hypothetical protein